MLPWVHSTQRLKHYLGHFGRVCTADVRESLYNGPSLPFQNFRFVWGCGIHLTHGSEGLYSCPQPKWHLERFSRFAGLTIVTGRPSDRPTDRPRYSVCNSSPHLRT